MILNKFFYERFQLIYHTYAEATEDKYFLGVNFCEKLFFKIYYSIYIETTFIWKFLESKLIRAFIWKFAYKIITVLDEWGKWRYLKPSNVLSIPPHENMTSHIIIVLCNIRSNISIKRDPFYLICRIYNDITRQQLERNFLRILNPPVRKNDGANKRVPSKKILPSPAGISRWIKSISGFYVIRQCESSSGRILLYNFFFFRLFDHVSMTIWRANFQIHGSSPTNSHVPGFVNADSDFWTDITCLFVNTFALHASGNLGISFILLIRRCM